MIRNNFYNAMEDLQKEILKMGNIVEEMTINAVEALVKQDEEIAQLVIERDLLVNQLDLAIEDKCMKLIATQQPMGKDLRTIGSALNIIKDLERIGDLSCDIAKTAKRIAHEPIIKPLIDIPHMAQLTKEMVKKALDSYVREDLQLAKQIAHDDDKVDKLHSQIFRELLLIMMQDPKTINQATYLLFISRYLERIGDYATNICESVVYIATGERKDLNP